MDLLLIIKYSALISFGTFLLVIFSSYIISKSRNNAPAEESSIDGFENNSGLSYSYYGSIKTEQYYAQPVHTNHLYSSAPQRQVKRNIKSARPKYTIIKEL